MGTVELRTGIHKMVDNIQNEQLLQALYDFLKVKQESKPGKIWMSLTEEQKQEVLLAFDESEKDENLISVESFFEKSDK